MLTWALLSTDLRKTSARTTLQLSLPLCPWERQFFYPAKKDVVPLSQPPANYNIQTQPRPGTKRRAFRAAFPHTIPIMAGFLFLGISYGIYMNVSGFSFWYPMLMALTIFGGSLEFVAVSMLLSPFAPLQTLLMSVVIQARHLFYGISMLDKFKDMRWKKPYLIFGMCDESFSINFSAQPPESVDRGWFLFFVTLLNHCYWVAGATLGGLFGSLLTFNTQGLDFVMTALFVVIFLDQWKKETGHYGAWIGILSSVVCLRIFGPDHFMIPTMICVLVLLTALRTPIGKAGGYE